MIAPKLLSSNMNRKACNQNKADKIAKVNKNLLQVKFIYSGQMTFLKYVSHNEIL